MMRLPTVYTANRRELFGIIDNETNIGGSCGPLGNPPPKWVPARPVGYCKLELRARIARAWAVFIGRCDVLQWEDNQ